MIPNYDGWSSSPQEGELAYRGGKPITFWVDNDMENTNSSIWRCFRELVEAY
jgi:hypothetical protein